jgi:hypothetical protein
MDGYGNRVIFANGWVKLKPYVALDENRPYPKSVSLSLRLCHSVPPEEQCKMDG